MGKYTLGICDICGLRYKHSELKKNWLGQMVDEGCFEVKHPQLSPVRKKLDDPKPIKDARPDAPVEEMDAADSLANHKPSTAGQGDQDL